MVDFSRMNGSSFERLVRALAFEILGPGGTVYSAGPDGGRDYTFDGKIRGYETKKWSGYLVLQSKYREGPERLNDAEWLLAQLKSDWDAIKAADGLIKMPEYYIIASNVKLSGADGRGQQGRRRVGGWTKVETWLKGLVKAGDIRDFDIWSGDKIADLLASHPSIAQNFAAWTTPGDVLTQLLQSVRVQTPSFPEIIRRSMKTELRRDQFARLKDAGSVDNDDIQTSHVFVDLPVRRNSQDDAKDNALQAIVALCRGVFRDDRLETRVATEPDPNKIVLMGGPGQGKSTLTTFLAQFFRAKIITEAHDDDNTVKYIIPEILRRAKSEGVDDLGLSRYPVWISLPKFADAVAAGRSSSGKIPSLLAYVASSFETTADQEIKREDLRAWLKTYPWIVILDGLDEVPSSGERPAILEAIKSFETEVAESNGDVVLVVTTRPQGYNHDLNPKDWSHWQLQPLTPEQALRYAEELGKALHRDDQSRRNEVLIALREASSKPSTSRLMTNPLQVTILHMIVDTGGGVPPGRWNLFNGYYEVLKRREKAKGGEIRRAIERNWNWLGPIHQRVGLALHLESEVSGGANAFLTPDEFRKLVRDYLSSETLPDEDSEARADELQRLAVDRLVLLTAKEQGRIAFDVRSLQEFMAAAALTSTGPLTIEPRLRSIAHASHWRNVFLIAASRCFDEDAFHWIRAAIISIPRAIEGNLIQLYLRRGARLALDMFHDGLAIEHPDFRRQLANHALDILNLGPREYDARLPRLYEGATASMIMDVFNGVATGQTSPLMTSSAWMMALDLCRLVPSLQEQVEQNVPSGESLINVLTRLEPPLPTMVVGDKIRAALLCCDPFEVMSTIQMYLRREGAGHDENSSMLRPLSWRQGVVGRSIRVLHEGSLAYHYAPVNVDLPHIDCSNESPWRALNEVAELCRSISARATAQFLRNTYSRQEAFSVLHSYRGYLPWPLVAIFSSIDSISDVLQLADDVDAGAFGDVSDWLQAEERWSQYGICDDDLELAAKSGRFFGKEVAKVGMPQLEYLTKVFDAEVKDALAKFVSYGRSSPHILFQRAVATSVGTLFDELDHSDYDKSLISEIIELATEAKASMPAYFFSALADEYWEDDALADSLSYVARSSSRHFHPALPLSNHAAMLDAYERHPARRGGIIKLVFYGLHQRHDEGQFYRLKTINLASFPSDDPEVVSQKSVLRALFQDRYDAGKFVEAVTSVDGQAPFASSYLLRDDVLPVRAAALAELIIEKLRQDDKIEDGVNRSVLNRVLDRLPSEIHDADRWLQLELPAEVRRMLEIKRGLGSG